MKIGNKAHRYYNRAFIDNPQWFVKLEDSYLTTRIRQTAEVRKIRISKIRKLIKLVEKSDIEELEISGWGKSIRIAKRVNQLPNEKKIQERSPAVLDILTKTQVSVKEEVNLVPIKSLMVGTFYRAPAPDAKPYIEIGQTITVGQIVCIIEAMKLMNEIESEVAGEVVKICVENEKPVEFGQVLFLVKP